MATVTRAGHGVGSNGGLTTLVQRFRFTGTSAAELAELLRTAPLTGAGSIFGARPGEEQPTTDGSRQLTGFSPVAGYRFDVTLVPHDDATFVVRFAQPDLDPPYLAGGFLWRLTDDPDGAVVLEEQINTRTALAVVDQPLDGPRPSLRRWAFFRVGHAQVMRGATDNLAALATGAGGS